MATYQLAGGQDPSAAARLKKARHVYWGSGSQFDRYGGLAAEGTAHYSGPGKTAAHLRASGIKPVVFPSVEEWRKWLKIN